jgi:hypothetical protein
MSASGPHPAAFVAGNDAPLISERAATRGRIATEGGDAHAHVRRTSSVRAPASRTGPHGGNRRRPLDRVKRVGTLALLAAAVASANVTQRNARGERRDQGRARSSMTHSYAFVAHYDAPPIDERAATRRRDHLSGSLNRSRLR